jgi:hypothetical protein
MTWYGILQADPQGKAWTNLAQEWIAASLNLASGASAPVSVQNAMAMAQSLLAGNCGSAPQGLMESAVNVTGPLCFTSEATALSGLLDEYNNGVIGPGHCSSEFGTTESTPVIYPNPANGSAQVHIHMPNYPGVSDVIMDVYTIAFRKVAETYFPQVRGDADLPLNLVDKQGNFLANGLYYIEIKTSMGQWTVKLLVLK